MYKRMLVPLDGSKLAEVVFPYARELSGLLGTEIILLHISNLGKDFQPMSHAYVEHAAEHIKGRETSEWKALLTKPISVNSDLVSGYPPDEILRYAEEKKVDLILMASMDAPAVTAGVSVVWLIKSCVLPLSLFCWCRRPNNLSPADARLKS